MNHPPRSARRQFPGHFSLADQTPLEEITFRRSFRRKHFDSDHGTPSRNAFRGFREGAGDFEGSIGGPIIEEIDADALAGEVFERWADDVFLVVSKENCDDFGGASAGLRRLFRAYIDTIGNRHVKNAF